MPLAIGQQGFNASKNHRLFGPGHLKYTDSWVVEDGILQKEGGASKLNSSALGAPSKVLAGISWSPAGGANYDVVELDNGAVLQDTGLTTFPTTLVSGLTVTDEPPPLFVPGGGESAGSARKLFLFQKDNQVQVVIGTATTMASISGPPADWSGAGQFPTFGVVHGGRLFSGGNASDPHRLYFTTLANHQDFAGGGTLSVFPGEGAELVGGVSLRGTLIVWKYPRGIYSINTQDPTPANWTVSRLSESIGGLNQHTIFGIDNDVLFVSQDGSFHLLSLVNLLGDFQTSNISHQAYLEEFIRSDINMPNIRRSVGVYYPSKRQAWIAMPRLGSQDNNIRFLASFANPQIPVAYYLSRRDTVVSMWNRPDVLGLPIPVTGDDAGFIWLMDRASRNKGGVAYTAFCRTGEDDFTSIDPKLATLRKSVQFLEIDSEASGDWNIKIEVWCDNVLSSTRNFVAAVEGGQLGTFLLDTDVLAADEVVIQRKRITGSGRHISLTLENSGLDQNALVGAIYLSLVTNNEDAREL